jgi:adenylate kinase
VEGVCDKCGGELYQRDDDTESTVRNRLEVYRAQTEPLIGYYDQAGVVARIDGAQLPEVTYEEIRAALGPADA